MKTLKKIVISCVAVLIFGVLSYIGYVIVHYKLYDDYKDSFTVYEYKQGQKYQPLSDSNPQVEGMDLVSESDCLKLYANTKTGIVAVYDKRSGAITYSNPIGSDEDPIANKTCKEAMKSQLIISYYTKSRNTATMNSYESCTSVGQVEVESIENGIRYIYTIGDLSSKTGIVPSKLLEERMNELLEIMDEKEGKSFKGKYDLNNGVYELMENVKTKQATLRKMVACLEGIGYTQEDFEKDSADAGAEDSVPICFVIPLEYTLKDDYVEVNVPTAQIKESGGASIYMLNVLNYFAAAGTNETGYMLVPNASGSLIHFNNGKSGANVYAQYVYGLDQLEQNYTQVQTMDQVNLPLWGIQKEETTILATIESGDSLAMISAGVSGKIGSYNYVYPAYTLRGSETLSMSGSTGNEADLPVVETNFTKVDLTTRYSFLPTEYSGYSGMANYYRERLINEGVLSKNDKPSDISLYLDILGGIRREEYALGIQYNTVYPMTTFEEAKEIASYFLDQGITPIMNYQGWFNGGYYHDVADKIKGLRKLGGKKRFEELASYLEENGGKLYADVGFQKVSMNSKRYSYSEESSRYYASGYPVMNGVINPTVLTTDWAMGYGDRAYYILSPKFLLRYADTFSKKIKDYDITGISLRDLGSCLSSDKKRTKMINRQNALDIVEDALDIIHNTGMDVMISGANSYAWNYADDLINIPLGDNEFYIVDEAVPFYEMLVHGSIDYCGNPVNLSENYNYTDTVLNLVEYGAAPHFTFSWEDTSELKYTSLNNWYNISFHQAKEQKDTGISSYPEDATMMYQEVSKVLNQVSNSYIVSHEILESEVRKITYDNGVTIYVNRLESPVTVDGVTINAKDYAVKEAK